MKVCLFGSRGYIGQYFLTLYPEAITPPCDIADAAAVAAVLDKQKPDIVINAAGKTGRPNVDWCESHMEETIRSNVTGALVLFHEARRRGIYLVHLGSGCIYEGDNEGAGFTEEDLPNFSGSFYAKSKAWIDQILKEFPVLSLRLRMPFDGTHSERNLIMKLIRYSRVLDVPNSLTNMPDFLQAAKQLIDMRKTGIYNIVNPGTISPWEIIQLYREQVDTLHVAKRLSLEDLSQVVKAGRSNCVLNTAKLEAEGITLRPVRTAIEDALQDLAKIYIRA